MCVRGGFYQNELALRRWYIVNGLPLGVTADDCRGKEDATDAGSEARMQFATRVKTASAQAGQRVFLCRRPLLCALRRPPPPPLQDTCMLAFRL